MDTLTHNYKCGESIILNIGEQKDKLNRMREELLKIGNYKDIIKNSKDFKRMIRHQNPQVELMRDFAQGCLRFEVECKTSKYYRRETNLRR